MDVPGKVADKAIQVERAVRARPSDFDDRDFRPFRPRCGSSSPVPVPQRTIFQPGTDWKAASTKCVLDALHTSCARQIYETETSSDNLHVSRCSGSVAVDASMADFFEGPVDVPVRLESQEPSLVQCKNCHRPVLMTRFLNHHDKCANDPQVDESRNEGVLDLDPQMVLIRSPYGRLEQKDDGTESKEASECRGTFAIHSYEESGGLKRARSNVGTDGELEKSQDQYSFPSEEDNWKSTLSSLAPSYVPRGSTSRRRRILFSYPVESNNQKKRGVNMERKASLAANAAGMISIQTQNGTASVSKNDLEEDPVVALAKELGDSAPWSKLMQIAMPISTPRNPNAKKVLSSRDYPNALLHLQSTGNASVAGVASSSKGRPGDIVDKQTTNFITPAPSLVGSLMWIRSKGLKSLSNTALYNMDVPQPPVGRTGAIFHGQTYVADLGTFETDPRAQTTIKMPLATSSPAQIPGKGTSTGGSTGKNPGSVDVRTKKLQGASTNSNTGGVALHQPLSKKQRTVKGQRAHSSGANGQAVTGVASQGKSGQPSSRKAGGSARAHVSLPQANATSAAVFDSQHHPHSGRNSIHLNVNTANAPLSTPSAAAAKFNSQQITQQKKIFRPVTGGMGMVGRVAQPLPVGLGPGGGASHVTTKGSSRGVKARPYPGHLTNTASPSVRAGMSKVTKTPSPSQGSSRSGDRLPMHRGVPMSATQFDPVLMGPAANVAAVGVNRVAAIRGGTGKAQLDFQQAMAQVAGKGVVAAGSEGANGSLGMLQQGVPKGQIMGTDKFGAQMRIRGMVPAARGKQNVSNPGAQPRIPVNHKNSRVQGRAQSRKDDMQQKAAELEAQLRRSEAMAGDQLLASKVAKMSPPIAFGNRADRTNIPVNHGATHPSAGIYTAALAAQHGPNTAMKGQANLGLFRMAQASQNAAGAGTTATPNVLQNMHDVRPMQTLGVVPGMQTSGHNPNVLSFLQASALSGGIAMSGGMPMSAGMQLTAGVPPAGAISNVGIPTTNIPNAGNAGMMSTGDAILQQLLSAGRGTGLMANPAALHAQAMSAQGTQLGQAHAHQIARTSGMVAPISRPVAPTTPNAAIAIDEIDRALGLTFDESDLRDS